MRKADAERWENWQEVFNVPVETAAKLMPATSHRSLITIIDIRRKIMWHNRSSNYTTSHKKEETKMEETRDVEVKDVEAVNFEDVESKEALWTKARKSWVKILIGAGVVGAGMATAAAVVSLIRSGKSEAVADDDNCIDTSEEDTDSALETEETTETEPFAESTEVVNQ